MMDAPSAANLFAYSAQIACVVGAGALLPSVLRLDAAGVRYQYWRVLGLLCLALPWLQPRITQPPRISAGLSGVSVPDGASDGVVHMPSAASLSTATWWDVAAGVLALGIAVRLVWIAIGLLELRRLRRAGAAARACDEHDELQRTIGTRAEIRYVDRVAQPVTFGVVKPIVLLPSTLLDRPEHIRRAVVAHELLHVQRRDWAWVLVEELVRAAFWFHPAAWWLVSRIQLAREELVDELAVLVTGRRRTYVEALLAFADETPLAPAAAFARRRHLFRRMMLISKETAMPAKRIVTSCAVMALIVACGSWYAVGAFPLVNERQNAGVLQPLQKTPGPFEQKAVPITAENPIPRRVSVTPAEYPAAAAAHEATGSVTIQLTLDDVGGVTEARVTKLHVRTASAEMRFQNVTPADLEGMFARGSAAGQDATGLRTVVDAFVRSAVEAVRQWRYEPPYQAPISFPVTITFASSSNTAATVQPPPPPPPPPPPSTVSITAPAPGEQSIGWAPDGSLRVGGSVKPPEKIKDVPPVYPPTALAAGVEGVVIIEARIAVDGRVSDARVLKSIPLLDEAALEAVKQWEFTPTLLNGERVPVVMTMAINFSVPER